MPDVGRARTAERLQDDEGLKSVRGGHNAGTYDVLAAKALGRIRTRACRCRADVNLVDLRASDRRESNRTDLTRSCANGEAFADSSAREAGPGEDMRAKCALGAGGIVEAGRALIWHASDLRGHRAGLGERGEAARD